MPLSASRPALLTPEKITIAMIATYPEMSHTLASLIENTNIELLDINASFEEAALAAKHLENKVDIILTRGGTGHYVKKATTIPVISIPITPFDLTVSISRLPANMKKIAFSNYHRAILGAEYIEKIFDKEIHQYCFHDNQELKQIAVQAKKDGCDVLFGGSVAVSYALEIGLPAYEIVSGREAIYQALTEAIEVIHVQREEQNRSARLKIALNSLTEGICITDEAGQITVFNPAVSHMFSLNDQPPFGKNIHDILSDSLVPKAFLQRTTYMNQIEKINNITINSSHIPIYNGNEFIGSVSTFQDITKIQRLEGQIRQQLSQRGLKAKYTFSDILTNNKDMEQLKMLAAVYAKTDAAILIEGESGTGKELFAHSIHNASSFALGPFVTVNCAAIPENLLESELFGYASGAFTGARKEGKKGLFELAHNGTIFLDEIGEMPKYLQSRLLRVLQEKEIMRVGDNKIISVNCRIISATNKNLADLVSREEFRKDLYYRLNIFNITIPPLRNRKEDILLLAKTFIKNSGIASDNSSVQAIIQKQLQRLEHYHWPGNIRELSNICARLTVLQEIHKDIQINQYLNNILVPAASNDDYITIKVHSSLPLDSAMEEAECQYIDAILERNRNNRTQAAKQLGIGRTTLWRRNTNQHTPNPK